MARVPGTQTQDIEVTHHISHIQLAKAGSRPWLSLDLAPEEVNQPGESVGTGAHRQALLVRTKQRSSLQHNSDLQRSFKGRKSWVFL